jgi:Bacterial SH3 domain
VKYAVLILAFLSQSSPGQDPASARAFVEIVAEKRSYFVHEAIEVSLLVGVDAAWFKANAIQTSRVQLDVPVEVAAPWIRELPGTVPLADAGAPPPGARRLTLAVNGEKTEAVLAADRVVSGRPFTVLRLAKRVLATTPGPFLVPAPTLRFAYATRFEEDLVSGRVPVDRKDATLRGADLSLTIVALPEVGRPAGFAGAVGQFRITTSADRAEVAPGESFKLAVTVEGEGNLHEFETPRLEQVPGLRVLGALDTKLGARRRIVYDVAVESDQVRSVPPIPFLFFDPSTPPQYRTVWAAPIPLAVEAGPANVAASAPAPSPPPLVPGESDIFGLKASPAARADRAFATARYEEAFALYGAALDATAAGDGAVLFDLGSAAWRLGRHAEALLFWRRAALRLPRDPEVAFNVSFAERQLEVEAAKSDAVFAVLSRFARGERLAAGAALAAAALVGMIFARRRRLALVLLAATFLLGLALIAHALGWIAGAPRGVVLAPEIGLREQPHRDSAAGLRLRAGETVRVAEHSDRWARVVHARGSGWTERAGIGVVE